MRLLVFYPSGSPLGFSLPTQQKTVAAIERERAMVESAQGLAAAMEAKIKALIGGLWEKAETP